MKKYQLTSVNSPSIDFEIGDSKVTSSVIKSLKRNPNFDEPLFFFDVVSKARVDVHTEFGISCTTVAMMAKY